MITLARVEMTLAELQRECTPEAEAETRKHTIAPHSGADSRGVATWASRAGIGPSGTREARSHPYSGWPPEQELWSHDRIRTQALSVSGPKKDGDVK